MSFRFDRYDVRELEQCGTAFRSYVRTLPDSKETDEWTHRVIDWFTKAKCQGGCVHPVGGRKGEFLVDCCHTTYPAMGKNKHRTTMRWWDRALRGPCQVKLALESEWGKSKRPAESLAMILDDARKLAAIRAQTKVMVFASQSPMDRPEILSSLQMLRDMSADQTPWLCIDISWEFKHPDFVDYRILSEFR